MRSTPPPQDDVHTTAAADAEQLALTLSACLAASDPSHTLHVRALLWNRGVACFAAREHKRAAALFHAAQAWDDVQLAVESSRALALCSMCCNDSDGCAC